MGTRKEVKAAMAGEALPLELTNTERRQALAAFQRQVRAWGLTMPPGTPLVMDFGLGQYARVGLIEYWIANELRAGYCGKYLFVFDRQQCPLHSHGRKHETFFVVKGKVRLTVNGKARKLNPGNVLAMPPGDEHSFTGIGNALLLEVSTPCIVADNRFRHPRIRRWLKLFARAHT